ncbi:unnamed protein product [Pneumocystis jirovecii]|uniref:BAR domain-containing protein n=1 Tax=Pneumocystis jirovecii TaxID=42068 RepID=L0PAK4_PNEJI|nr:unnamed protein product [Pneumocystis jirovecii]
MDERKAREGTGNTNNGGIQGAGIGDADETRRDREALFGDILLGEVDGYFFAGARGQNAEKQAVNRREDGKQTVMGAFSKALLDFGEGFPPESVYGQGLLKYGAAHKEISKIQEQFINDVSNTVLGSMDRSLVQFKDYQTARKKLESRRLSYDSVSNRFLKAKKEDPRIEEELRVAKAKYEEACENIYTRIYAIQQLETTQLSNLAALLDMESKYYKNCHIAIQELKKSWEEINNACKSSSKYVKCQKVSAHAFNNENTIGKMVQPFQSKVSLSSSINNNFSKSDLNSSENEFVPRSFKKTAPKSVRSTDHEETCDETFEIRHSSEKNIENPFLSEEISIVDQQTSKENSKKNTENSDVPIYKKNVFPIRHNSTLKNSNVTSFQNTSQDSSDDDYTSYNEDRSDSYLENNSYDSSNTFSRSDISISKPCTYSKIVPGFKNSEPLVVKNTKPSLPSRASLVPNSNKINNTCKSCDCKDFQESLFKKGQCNQCFHNH